MRQAGVFQRLQAEAGQAVEGSPVVAAKALSDGATGVPVEIEDLQVVRAELVAYLGQHRLGAEGGGEAVGHVAGHGHRILEGEGAFLDAQQVEFHRQRAAGLELVDAVQVGLQRLDRGAVALEGLHVALGMLADAQTAEQAVGIDQLGPQHLGQLAARQAAQQLHLEQAVLGVDKAQCAVQVGFVAGLDMRYAALVVAHLHRRLQAGQRQRAVAHRQFVVDIPGTAGGGRGNHHGEDGQTAFHDASLLLCGHSAQHCGRRH